MAVLLGTKATTPAAALTRTNVLMVPLSVPLVQPASTPQALTHANALLVSSQTELFVKVIILPATWP